MELVFDKNNECTLSTNKGVVQIETETPGIIRVFASLNGFSKSRIAEIKNGNIFELDLPDNCEVSITSTTKVIKACME